MTDSEKYFIDNQTGKFTLKEKYKPTIPFLQYIPRYIERNGERVTLQQLGWRINLDKNLDRAFRNQLVTFCEHCQVQRTFTIVRENKTISKNGHEYVKNYLGYCNCCKEGEKMQ